jgi:hypothetical protein
MPGSLLESPLSLTTVPVTGTSPDAALDPSSDGSDSTASTPASTAPSGSFTDSKRFPGQGLAPYIKPPLYMDYGTSVDIGTSTFINRNCKILDTPVRIVKIGERCLIGPDFSIYAVSHPLGKLLFFFLFKIIEFITWRYFLCCISPASGVAAIAEWSNGCFLHCAVIARRLAN